MEPSELAFGLSRETTIHRDAEGRWFHDGELVENEKLARAFDSWVERAPDGRYCLKNAINWAYVTIDGAPFFVRAVHVTGDVAHLTLSNQKRVALDPRTLREGPEGALYCDVEGGMTARFDKHAASQLAELLEEDEQGTYVRAGTMRVRPPRVLDPVRHGLPTADSETDDQKP
jgi:hypothetical protein